MTLCFTIPKYLEPENSLSEEEENDCIYNYDDNFFKKCYLSGLFFYSLSLLEEADLL